MKKLVVISIKLWVTFLTCLFLSYDADAQLPKIQEISVRAPANIKIDGMATEWDNKYLAKNPDQRIQYIVSNDDKNLYLTVYPSGANAIAKIMNGGISFIISHSTDKKIREKDANNVTVSYPLGDKERGPRMADMLFYYWNSLARDTVKNKQKIDSLYRALGMLETETFAEIKVEGVKDVDPVISVYNITGIKANMHIDKKFSAVYEMAIPLKYLGLSTENPVVFSYNIRINPKMKEAVKVTAGDLAQSLNVTYTPNPAQIYAEEITNLWGTYTLAKQP